MVWTSLEQYQFVCLLEDLDGIPRAQLTGHVSLLSLLRQFLVVFDKAGGFYEIHQSWN